MHLSRRFLRHITWMISVMWLLALGAGVANACLLNPPNDNTQSSFSVANPSTPFAHDHQEEQPDPSIAGCLKFCDEPGLTTLKLNQPFSDGAGLGCTLTQELKHALNSTTEQLSTLSHRPAHMALPIAARPHRLTL
jgi:hypothetical protein